MSDHSPRVLVAESKGFSAMAAGQLREVCELILANLDRRDLLAAVVDVDVLWVRLRHRIDAEVLRRAKRLRGIVTATTGVNHIDQGEVRSRGIWILSLRGESQFLKQIRATAEHTIGLMFALLRCIPNAANHVRDGGWNRELFLGRELYGKTVGIVGYGRLGRIVAAYLQPFGVRVLATDPKVNKLDVGPGVSLVSLEELLREADIVTVHVNLEDETRGFFGRRQFESMKPGACFINTARGELVDEGALLDSLATGQLRGASLDVLAGELAEDKANTAHPLVAYACQNDNLVITPHIGGCTVESMEKTESFLAGKLLRLLDDKTGVGNR